MRALAAFVLALAVTGGAGCKRQHFASPPVAELPYPTCPAGTDMTPQLLYQTELRSGKSDTRMSIVEHFRFEKRGCLFAAVTRQEWPVQIADVEALYDASMKPLRVWRRHTVPAVKRADGKPDFKLFELRGPEATIKHKSDAGMVDFETLRSPLTTEQLVGPGRGIVSVWLKQAKLAVGQKTHAAVLDFRGVEKIERGALERFPDRDMPELGGRVRVYTYLGKESIYANDDDIVIGDLAGLVPADRAPTPAPPPMSRFEPIDPVHPF